MMVERLTPLGRLLSRLSTLAPDDRVDAVLGEIAATGGINRLDTVRRPDGGSNIFDIQLHGVGGFGTTVTDAATSWIDAALSIVYVVEDIARAWRVLDDPETGRTARLAACETILMHSTHPAERARARALLIELGGAGAPAAQT